MSTEQSGQDECSLQPGCSVMWPALPPPSNRDPSAGSGAGGVLGVIIAADGGLEVTYSGWPLHTFGEDAPGQVDGQRNASFGGIWSVATPALALASGAGAAALSGLQTPSGLTTPPGALPTNPFAPSTPPGIPAQPPLPTIPSSLPTQPY
ncbi:MAG: COG4315 family predicted lipoprotein [Candidatus Dormibacteria bacterium]